MDAAPPTRPAAVCRLRFAAAALTAVALMLVIGPGPAAAAGKREKYAGPVDLRELEPGVVPHASIEFTVHSKSRRGSHTFIPKLVNPLKERNIYYTCNPPYQTSSGTYPYAYPTEGNGYNNFLLSYEGRELWVKHRVFSGSYTDTYSDGGSRSWSVVGIIPPSGPATGKIRISEHFPSGHDCDTGVLSWSASKK